MRPYDIKINSTNTNLQTVPINFFYFMYQYEFNYKNKHFLFYWKTTLQKVTIPTMELSLKNLQNPYPLHLLYAFNSYGKVLTFLTKWSGEEC